MKLYTHRCMVCPALFYSSRPDAVTCSSPCRQALYRLRKKRATQRRAVRKS